MAKINWTYEAVDWLEKIYNYISKDSQEVAQKVVEGIYEKVQILKSMPEIGYKYQNKNNIRILLYGHYRIAYLMKDRENIDILGVFHGSLEIEKYLEAKGE